MAFVLRGLGKGIPSFRPTCLGITRWQLPDGKLYSSEGSKPPEEAEATTRQKAEVKDRRTEAKLKLNSLLESIQKQQPATPAADGGVSSRLARPGARPRPKEVVPNTRRPPAAAATVKPRPDRQPTLDQQVAEAAREVASSLAGDPAETERDLLRKLSEDDGRPSTGQSQLSDLMSSMKVDQQRPAPSSRSHHVRQQLGGERADALRQVRRERPRVSSGGAAAEQDVDLKSGDVLGVFSELKPAESATEMTTPSEPTLWDRVHERELRLSVTHPPANAWEEMTLWTEQGKLWQLPVDNEQGLEAEAAVGFHEHVFLEGHLEPWCPARGPVRQFMELVCVALGKNPWLTVQEKREHIDWFREYFAGKQKLLQELKAV